MYYRALRFAFAIVFIMRAAAAYGGATTIPEFRLGSCGTGVGAPACGWNCDAEINSFPVQCMAPNSCGLDVTDTFTAHAVVRVDDAPCGSAGGGVLEIGLFGTKSDLSTFTVPSRTINLCGVDNSCGACDTNVCSETDESCPLDVLFHCELTVNNPVGPETCSRPNAELGERRFCEKDVPNLASWLQAGKQPILAELAADLAAEFPESTGPPVVISATDIAVTNNSDDPNAPSIGRFCVEVGFLREPKPIITHIPPEVALAPRTTSPLVVQANCLCGNGDEDPGEECDDGNIDAGDGCSGACTIETTNCPAAPAPNCDTVFDDCLLQVNEKTAGKEKLLAKWLKGPAVSGADLGNPLANGGTIYDVCLYKAGGALAGEYRVDRAGDTCGTKPCWKKLGKPPGDPKHKGFNYKDKSGAADGVTVLLLKGGEAGKSKFIAKGKNNVGKGQTSLPTGVVAALTGSASATMQLHGSDATKCFSCALATVEKDDGVVFKASK